MHTIELVTIDGKSIYRGQHQSLNDAIEFAITHNIPLHNIDLSGATLHHINLDGVKFHNASFRNADLTGANMSEADFSGCDFSSAKLNDACLCYSNFSNCNFRLSDLKGADIAMTSLYFCKFEGFSTFDLRFDSAFRTEALIYYHFADQHLFHSPPILLHADDMTAAFLGNIMILSGTPHTFEYKAPARIPSHPLQNIQSMIDF